MNTGGSNKNNTRNTTNRNTTNRNTTNRNTTNRNTTNRNTTNRNTTRSKKPIDVVTNPPFPIDIVYTWKGESKSTNVRLGYNYELKYSLRSIELYAPWINKIFILMNKKKYPSWIKENDKIVVIEHLDTFPSQEYLPNFNSNAIETTIVNIKDLSEHYIYFNDDIFLGKKTKYTDFFTPSGKAVIDDYTIKNTTNIVKDENNDILNIEFPPSSDKIYKHIPIPQIKSIVLEFNEKYADFIHWVRKTKKRKNKGFDICKKNTLNSPCQQLHYPIAKFMKLKDKVVLKNNNENNIYIPNIDPNFEKKLKYLLLKKPLFFCINDVEPNPDKKKLLLDEVLDFFNTYYPNKAYFEK